MTIRLSLWDRWRAAMRSFLHCVEEGYRKSVTPYVDQRLIWDGDDIDEVDVDLGSTSTQLGDMEPSPIEMSGDSLMEE